MSEVLLHLWSNKRSHLLQELDFYLAQADKRVLTQFEDLEEEARQFADDEFKRMGRYAGPDSDPSDYADAAWSRGISHFQMLSDLEGQMRLTIAAGIYHHWEKQLREWLVAELDHSFPREKVGPAIWKAKIEELFDLLKGLGWDATSYPFADPIDQCRLVVNVFKHGGGPSFDLLKERYSRYLGEPRPGTPMGILDCRDHTDLEITREDLGRFQQALKSFWSAMPEHTFWTDGQTVPKWFEKALTKDK